MADERVESELPLSDQKAHLDELPASGGGVNDVRAARRGAGSRKIVCGEPSKTLKSFERDEKRLAKARLLAGFFAIITRKADMGPIAALSSCRLRDEQEKRFQMMKNQVAPDRRRNWSEGGKAGRRLIALFSLILGPRARHAWGAAKLRGLFDSALGMLDAMKPIRCVERASRAKMITPLVGRRLGAREAFGFEAPEGSAPAYASR